ncbi:hypothetical protein VKT23_020188 [Stygiomarasmius scandens]|uniref:Uncharacterized protein n=1 Tax=Marasmiellus scandens TaxID=2682957 RepID=A0ABR1IND9_9AGAR
MSEAGSHGTYGAYSQAPLGHSDGGETYQMRDLGASGPGPGGLFDHNAAYAAGAAGLGAGAAGIGIARARSQHGPHSANSGPDPNDPNGYYSYPSSASSPPASLERNLSNGS